MALVIWLQLIYNIKRVLRTLLHLTIQMHKGGYMGPTMWLHYNPSPKFGLNLLISSQLSPFVQAQQLNCLSYYNYYLCCHYHWNVQPMISLWWSHRWNCRWPCGVTLEISKNSKVWSIRYLHDELRTNSCLTFLFPKLQVVLVVKTPSFDYGPWLVGKSLPTMASPHDVDVLIKSTLSK